MPQPLKEILTGPQGAKYGALPKIAIPGDDETVLRFAQELLGEVKTKPIYRRDNIPVYPYEEKARIEGMNPSTFRTFIDRYVACFKQKFDDKGEPYDVVRTINRETAQGVLDCIDFWSGLREVAQVNPVPMPFMDAEGNVSLLQPGYDEKTKTLTLDESNYHASNASAGN
jgi:hypothetical protein